MFWIFFLFGVHANSMSSFELSEYHWEAVSSFLNLQKLRQILSCTGSSSIQSFNRCRSTVIPNVVSTIESVVDEWIRGNIPLELIFTRYLPDFGLIPKIAMESCSNRFIFVDRRGAGTWQEWNIPSLDIVRLFWETQVTNGLTAAARFSIEQCLQKWVLLLPGDFQTCSLCQWTLPQSEMYNARMCSLCEIRSRLTSITLATTESGVPYIQEIM